METRRLMARLPAPIPDLVAQFGPHLNREPAGGWHATGDPDRIVPTHCCFCGQQCGIQLKVKDEKIVGFEPWEAFPFNKGKLCPKGVKRYMQDEHPDRLLTPLARDEARGFQPIDWDAALDRTAREIQRIQAAYGNDAFAILTGASLTNEKAYLMGKFARVAVRTANIDYNGRLCMVSAAAASKKILGIDRSANPWSDIPKATGDPRRRREHRGVRADHDRLPVAGAGERREADRPRSAHDADRAHRRSLHPGALRRRHRRLLRHAPRDDPSAAGSTGTSSPRTRLAGTRSRRSSNGIPPSTPRRSRACPRR